MKKDDFYIDSILEETQGILKQLINDDVVKYHIERLLKNYVRYKFDDETIDIVENMLVDIPDIEISDIDFFTGKLEAEEKEYLIKRILMISEFDIYRYYLQKNEITVKEHRLLEQYANLMREAVNGYGIDNVEDEVTDILWKRYLGNINSYSSEYLIGKFFAKKGTYSYAQNQWKFA